MDTDNVLIRPRSYPSPYLPPEPKDEFEEVNEKGGIDIYRMVDGVKVLQRSKGSIKDKFKYALWRAALMTEEDIQDAINSSDITALEKSAIMLSMLASNGKMEAITQLFDRVMGKPKQTIENQNIHLTIDDVLEQAIPDNTPIPNNHTEIKEAL